MVDLAAALGSSTIDIIEWSGIKAGEIRDLLRRLDLEEEEEELCRATVALTARSAILEGERGLSSQERGRRK